MKIQKTITGDFKALSFNEWCLYIRNELKFNYEPKNSQKDVCISVLSTTKKQNDGK